MKNEMKSFEYNPVKAGLMVAGAMLLYAILPIDLIPDVAVGIGQLDDAIVLTAGTIFEVVNIVNAIKQKRQVNMADIKRYDYNEDAEDADYEEI